MADLALILLLLISCATAGNERQVLSDAEQYDPEMRAGYLGMHYSESSGYELSYNYAYYLIQDGNLERAMEVAKHSIMAFPDMIRFHYLKAYIEKSEMRLNSYEKTLLGILDFNPGDRIARDGLLTLYSQMRYKEKAISMAYDTLRLYPEDRKALSVLAEYSDFYKAVSGEPARKETAHSPRKKTMLIPYDRSFIEAVSELKDTEISR